MKIESGEISQKVQEFVKGEENEAVWTRVRRRALYIPAQAICVAEDVSLYFYKGSQYPIVCILNVARKVFSLELTHGDKKTRLGTAFNLLQEGIKFSSTPSLVSIVVMRTIKMFDAEAFEDFDVQKKADLNAGSATRYLKYRIEKSGSNAAKAFHILGVFTRGVDAAIAVLALGLNIIHYMGVGAYDLYNRFTSTSYEPKEMYTNSHLNELIYTGFNFLNVLEDVYLAGEGVTHLMLSPFGIGKKASFGSFSNYREEQFFSCNDNKTGNRISCFAVSASDTENAG
ncbi:MAG: hypothetical protein EBZ47_00020 [Chlamydiae bacterium]|nr:hypothetical protein [Chlamydiota bacterium]